MTKKMNRRGDMVSLCGELFADDGVDPRAAIARIDNKRCLGRNRKSWQLCKQVHRAVSMALVSEIGDPALHELEVASVEPAPDDTRLRIVLSLASDNAGIRESAGAALARASGLLRALVAQSITRKRTPELDFAIEPVPPITPDRQSGDCQ